MTKTAGILLTLAVLVVLGMLDHDGRIAHGDLAARLLGYVVRLEVRVERETSPPPPPSRPVPATRCVIASDSVTRVLVWR